MPNVTTSPVSSLPTTEPTTRIAMLVRIFAEALAAAEGGGLRSVLRLMACCGTMLELAVADCMPIDDGAHALASLGMLRGFRASFDHSRMRACDAARYADVLAFIESKPGPAANFVRTVADIQEDAGEGIATVLAIELHELIEEYGLDVAPLLGAVVELLFEESDEAGEECARLAEALVAMERAEAGPTVANEAMCAEAAE
jgi:hypothetical protein